MVTLLHNCFHEQVLYGIGDQHISLILDKLKAKYKVEVTTSTPIVQYRETIKGKAEAQGRYKKQNGGAGQFGDVWVRFEPSDEPDGDMVFAEDVFGGAVPKQFFPPTEQGLRDCMRGGVRGEIYINFLPTRLESVAKQKRLLYNDLAVISLLWRSW